MPVVVRLKVSLTVLVKYSKKCICYCDSGYLRLFVFVESEPNFFMLRSGLVLGTLAVAAFGLTLPFTRIAVLATSAFDVFVLRLLLASATAALALIVLRVGLPEKSVYSGIVVVSAGVVFGFPLFTSLAMQTEAAAHGGVVLGVLPLATAIAGSLINRERPSMGFWITALAGSVLVVTFALLRGGGGLSLADAYLLLAVVSASAGYAMGAQLVKQMPAWQVISWALVFALPVAIVLACWVDWQGITAPALATDRWSVWSSLVYLGLVSQYGGFLLWYRALSMDGVARTSQIQLVQPFFTLAGAAWLLAEDIDGQTLGFAVLILFTVLMSRRMQIGYTTQLVRRR